ncbi:MAG: hypothetical protein ACP5RS_01355 [Thermoplasmata archaeon]
MILLQWSNLLLWLAYFLISTDIAVFIRIATIDMVHDLSKKSEIEVCYSCPLYSLKKEGKVCDNKCDFYHLDQNVNSIIFALAWVTSLIAIAPSQFINFFLPPQLSGDPYIIVYLLVSLFVFSIFIVVLLLYQSSITHNRYAFNSILSIFTIVMIFFVAIIYTNFIGYVILIALISLLLSHNLISLGYIKTNYSFLAVPIIAIYIFFIIMVIRIIQIIELGTGITL